MAEILVLYAELLIFLVGALLYGFLSRELRRNPQAVEANRPFRALVTSLAMACPFDPPEKQALLEAMTLSERAETLITILRMSVLESDHNMPRQ